MANIYLQSTNIPRLARRNSCLLCGTWPKNGTIIRTEVDIEFEGEVGFCIPCGKAIGRAAGLVAPKKYLALKDEHDALVAETAAMREKAQRLDAVIALIVGTPSGD